MTEIDAPADRHCDVMIAGAGLAGLAAAVAFARAGFDVVCSGGAERPANGRTVALLDRSVAYLKSLSLWPAIEPEAAPLRRLLIVDDTGGLFPPRPVEFESGEIGLDAFGWNVENDRLAAALAAAAERTPGVERTPSAAAQYDFSGARALARLSDGRVVAAAIVIGADGRNSPSRRAAGLSIRAHRYPQTALTVILSHRLPHRDRSIEFHTRAGPFTLVPLPANELHVHRSSLVWVMAEDEARRRSRLDDTALGREIEDQARSVFGAMWLEGARGETSMARQVVPRIASLRLALVGDAAHALPPIGAQGLNLGLRDVAAIADCAARARAEGRDIGGDDVLREYESRRRADIFLRSAVVHGLNQALITRFGPLDFARAAGLASLGAIGPLRRFVMREGVAPHLMR
ncbi:MAG: FAD-dependent monooxygenase [Hyphomicrobiales bacterium]|nr:FAD-dependent monooxygenase [Hyphomicrobiales bacterium]